MRLCDDAAVKGATARARRGSLLIPLLVVAAFGPYVTITGARTEQIAAYGLAVVLLPLTLPFVRLSPALVATGVAWLALTGVALVGALDTPTVVTGWLQRGAFAGLDNLLLPIAVVLIVAALLGLGMDPNLALRRAGFVLVVAMLINVGAAWMQTRGSMFTSWWGTNDEQSVALNALANGRFGGLINQPAEAGLLYGMAMLAALYLWPHRSGLLILTLSVLSLGGVLSVSKVFLLVAVPLMGLWLLRTTAGRGRRFALLGVLAVALTAAVGSGYLASWPGVGQLRALIPGQGALLQTLSGGRCTWTGRVSLGRRST